MNKIKIRDCTSGDEHELSPTTQCIPYSYRVHGVDTDGSPRACLDLPPAMPEALDLGSRVAGDLAFVVSDMPADDEEHPSRVCWWLSEVL